MLNLQNYGNSSESETETEKLDALTSHLKPVDKELSVVKTMPLVSIAPVVVPTVSYFFY